MARESSGLELQARRKEGRGLKTYGERGRSYPLWSSIGRGSGGAGAAQRRAAQGSRTKYPRLPSQCSGSLLLSEAGAGAGQVLSTVHTRSEQPGWIVAGTCSRSH